MKRRSILIILLMFIMCSCFADGDLSKQATAFYSDNNHEKTLDTLLQINENERTAQDWLLLGNLLEEKGQVEETVFMYQKSISTDTKFYRAYYNLANIYLAQNKLNLAIENYKTAIKYNKSNPYIHYNLACAYIKQGKMKEAKSTLTTALTLKNDVPEIHYNLAYVYKSMNKAKLAQAYLDNYNKLKADGLN
ncbi:MAG: tetratricopeptide repeat protein [bacterium]|nr:tetratricopeptide repeat protein [bacterium]